MGSWEKRHIFKEVIWGHLTHIHTFTFALHSQRYFKLVSSQLNNDTTKFVFNYFSLLCFLNFETCFLNFFFLKSAEGLYSQLMDHLEKINVTNGKEKFCFEGNTEKLICKKVKNGHE